MNTLASALCVGATVLAIDRRPLVLRVGRSIPDGLETIDHLRSTRELARLAGSYGSSNPQLARKSRAAA